MPMATALLERLKISVLTAMSSSLWAILFNKLAFLGDSHTLLSLRNMGYRKHHKGQLQRL